MMIVPRVYGKYNLHIWKSRLSKIFQENIEIVWERWLSRFLENTNKNDKCYANKKKHLKRKSLHIWRFEIIIYFSSLCNWYFKRYNGLETLQINRNRKDAKKWFCFPVTAEFFDYWQTSCNASFLYLWNC